MKERDMKVTHCPSTGANFGKNHQVSQDSLVLLFSDHGSPFIKREEMVDGGPGAV